MASQHQKSEKAYERTTITVPVDLKNRMKTLGRDVNWSSVACIAFDDKIEKIQAAERKQLEHAIIRLRTQKPQQDVCGEFEKGFSAGKQWAIEKASIDSLEKLKKMRASVSSDKWETYFVDAQCAAELASMLDDKNSEDNSARDELYGDGVSLTIQHGKGSVSLLQRELGIGYGRAARLMDMMEQDGIVESYSGSKPRKVCADAESRTMLRGSSPNLDSSINATYYNGFVEGALDVWATVKEAI